MTNNSNLSSTSNIQTSANSVIEAIQNGNFREAHRLWADFHATEPLTIREAYDRLIALQIDETTTQGYSQLNSEMQTQLSFSKEAPRIPSETEISALTNDQKFDVYNGITRLRGNTLAENALDSNDRVILGLRRENQTTENNGRGVYDDRIVVLWQNNDGTKHIEEFNRATTEPTAQYDAHYANDNSIRSRRSEGEDVNNDGTRDMGRLRSDNTITMGSATHARPGGQGDNFSLRPTAGFVRDHGANLVERDTNGDGWFNNQDVNGIADLNDTFKIHAGSRNSTDSAGCQTIHRDDYDRFIEAVRPSGSTQGQWQYVLSSTIEESHIERAREHNQNIEAIETTLLSLNTGNETVDLLLANLDKSMDNPDGFDLDVMMATSDTKEGKEFTANIDKAIEEMKVAEVSIENDIQLQNKSKGMEIS